MVGDVWYFYKLSIVVLERHHLFYLCYKLILLFFCIMIIHNKVLNVTDVNAYFMNRIFRNSNVKALRKKKKRRI